MVDKNPLVIKQSMYKDLGLESQGVSFDDFSSKFDSTPELRQSVYKDLGLESQGVDYGKFESTLGLGKTSGVSELGSLITPQESLEPTEVLRRLGESSPEQVGILPEQSLESADAIEPKLELPPSVEVQGTFREGLKGDWRYTVDGYEQYTPDVETIEQSGGWDNLAEFFKKEHSNVLLNPPMDINAPTVGEFESDKSASKNIVNIDTAKPVDFNSIKKVQELKSTPFNDWSADDKAGYFMNNIKEVAESKGYFSDTAKKQIELEELERQGEKQRKLDENDNLFEEGIKLLGTGIRQLERGSADLAKNVLGLPEFAVDVVYNTALSAFASPAERIALGANKGGIYDKAFGENDVFKQAQDWLDDAIERGRAYDKGRFGKEDIYDSFKNGHISSGLNKAVGAMTESLPIMAGLISGSGAVGVVSGLSMASGQKYNLDNNNPNMSQEMKLLNSTLYMMAEVFPEKLGADALIKPFSQLAKNKGKQIAIDSMDKMFRKYLGQFYVLTPHVTEMVTEWTTTVGQNAIAIGTGEDPDRKLSDGLADATIVSAGMSGVISTPGQIANSIYDKGNRVRVESIATENLNIQDFLQRRGNEVSSDLKAGLIEKVKNNISEINGYIESEIESKGKLNGKQKAIVDDLEERKMRMDAIIASDEISADIKAGIQADIDAVNNEIDTLIKTSAEENETKLSEEQVERKADIDAAITEFNKNNPDVEVDLFPDLPDSVVRTFDRVENGLPTDVTAIEETSDWLYNKRKSILAEKDNPNRRHTINQIDQIAEQLEEDITLLENYKYEQATGEKTEVQPERKVSDVPSEAEAGQAEINAIVEPEIIEPIVDTEQIKEAPIQPETRVNQKESDEVIEQRIITEEREARKARQAPFKPKSEFANQDEYSRYIAEKSNDPDEVAKEYLNVSPAEPDYIESAIADYIGTGKINESDYARYGDLNNIDAAKKSRWIDKSNKGTPLDVSAQELSDNLGIEITPAEFVDFVTNYAGIEQFQTSAKSDTQIALENKYKELTGRNLTPEIAERANVRFNENLSDEDIFEMDSDLQELGLTYQDILNYEEYNRQTTGMVQEAIPESNVDQSASEEVGGESETAQSKPKVKTKIPKSLMGNIVKRLGLTGLAKSINIVNSEDVNKNLGTDNGKNINGYVDADGNVFINEDVATVSTPVHELSHIWESKIEKDNPALHAQGMELIKGADGKSFVDYVKRTQPGLEGDALYKEALAQAIGDYGADMIVKHKSGKIQDWINKVWDWIAGQVGISGKTPDQIANMNLQQFSEAVAVDLLSGKPVATMPNGDIVIEAPKVISSNDQKKIDFLNKMRQKNGIKYSGNIDAQSLSDGDMRDFVEFVSISLEDGSIKNKTDLVKIANSIGIINSGDIDTAWNIATQGGNDKGFGIKKALVYLDRLLEIDYNGLSDTEYVSEGKRLVDEGIIDPVALVQDIILRPRALQPYEVTALVYYRGQIESKREDVGEILEKGSKTIASEASKKKLENYEYQGLQGKSAAKLYIDVMNQAIRDFEVVMISTANQQSSAFRLRGLMTDKDFNIVSYLADGDSGLVYIPPAVVEQMKALKSELDDVKSKLRKKAAKADADIEKINEGNIEQAANQEAQSDKIVKRRIVNRRATVDAFDAAISSLDFNEFAISSPRFQANDIIRFQKTADMNLSNAISSAVSAMQESVSSNRQSVPDAIETAIDLINKEVGKGKWDEQSFRSRLVNSMVQQGIPVAAKKPYTTSSGILVVPGAFLRSKVKDGVRGIDNLVTETRKEVGDSYTDYQIRNAISGYGRNAVKTRTDSEIELSRAKRIARLMSKMEDLQNNRRVAKNAKRVHDIDSETKDLLEQIKVLEAGITLTPEEIAQFNESKNTARQKYVDNYIERLQIDLDKIIEINKKNIKNKKQEAWVPKAHISKYIKDTETIALEKEAERIRNEFKKAKYENDINNRTLGEKLGDFAFDALANSTRAVMAGADLSAIGVQGMYLLASNPIEVGKTFAYAFSKSLSEKSYEDYFAELQADPFFELARKAKLPMQLPSFYQSVQEEQFKGNIPTLLWNETVARGVKRIAKSLGKDYEKAETKAKDRNPYAIADKNYSVFLSKLRFDRFKQVVTDMIVKEGIDVELDKKKLEKVARDIATLTLTANTATGSRAVDKTISTGLFSAGKLVATWRILLDVFPPTGIYRAYHRYSVSPALAKEYYSTLGRGMGALIALTMAPTLIASMMMGDDDDDLYGYNKYVGDPRHSDFMKIKLGDTRISLFQGVDGNVVLASRIAMREMMTASSSGVRDLGTGFNKDGAMLGLNYIANKLAPSPALVYDFFLGSDRERQEGADRLGSVETLSPMWISSGIDQYKRTGDITESAILTFLGAFGMGFNNYGGAEFAGPDGTNDKKARSILSQSGLSAYNPTKNSREAWDGKKVSRVGGERFDDVYIPAYEEYMTDVVKANEPKLSKDAHWEKKESLLGNLKKQAYKYAEIKTSGVYIDGDFNKVNDNGKHYIILKSDYNKKVDLINDFMNSKKADVSRIRAKRDVIKTIRKDGLKTDAGFIDKQVLISVYNEANREANKKLIKMIKMKKITPILSDEYIKDEDKWEDE